MSVVYRQLDLPPLASAPSPTAHAKWFQPLHACGSEFLTCGAVRGTLRQFGRFLPQVFNPNFQTHIRSPLDLERGVLRGKSVLPTTAERTPSARLRRVRPSAVRQGLRRAIGRYRQVQPTT